MIHIDRLIPNIEELKRRTKKEQVVKPTEESKMKMISLLRDCGYTNDNIEVYNALVGYGALLFDGTARKGLILSGPVGVGKTLGLQIIASKFKIPVFYPKLYASIYKELSGDPVGFEKQIVTAGDFHEEPRTIIIDELGQKDKTKFYGEESELMVDVLEARYRAFLKYGVKTIITTNLADKDLRERYGTQINDRLNEMCYFKAVCGKSLR